MINKKRKNIVFMMLLVAVMLIPELGLASVESSLMGVQTKLTRVILPTLSVIGIALAAFSFLSGNENAKKHIMYAVIGSVLGFGAQAIVDFISMTVH
ncbi:MAG: TrbC/VirB2 family protein [Bdellovibrionales bacterium]|nr:TrbC/VirB2 family protein [Bdellovibrionales bacterium]